jgi:hypothetical protein
MAMRVKYYAEAIIVYINSTYSNYLNYWVMHPVARVSIKYWNNLHTQQSIFGARFYCALLTLHVSATFGAHLQVVRKHKKYLR